MSGSLSAKGHVSTSWDELGWETLPNGVEVSQFKIGDDDDADAPAVFKVRFPPNCRIEPHKHACDYAEMVLEGAQKVSGEWYRSGDVRIGAADRAYGPLVTEDEGATVLVMFRTGEWPAIPIGGKHDGATLGVDQLTSRFA